MVLRATNVFASMFKENRRKEVSNDEEEDIEDEKREEKTDVESEVVVEGLANFFA